MPTPKNRNNISIHKQKEDSEAIDISAKLKKGYFNTNKTDKENDSTSKSKRSSLQRVKRVNKIPLGKRDINTINNPRSTSRTKQLSAKNRLVYKKDSMKTLTTTNQKAEISIGSSHPSMMSKIENKENDFTQMNMNSKLNRTGSTRDNQKNIKSMSGIRKLYTLKANNNTNRRLDSQSYRDINCSNTLNKKSHHKNKISTSETPKLRSNNEALFSGVKAKLITKTNETSEMERPATEGHGFVSNYDARILKKPPSSNSNSKHIKHNTFIKKPTKKSTDSRRANISMERESIPFTCDDPDPEAEKRTRVQEQILNHISTGKLPQDAVITPIISNDGQIRQYILNDPIANPDENENEVPLMPGHKILNTTVDKSKCSTRRNGVVKAYAANTNKGIIRNYNEDRVSIILNILKPSSRKGEDWPKCSFFGVFDGHGGSA